MSVSFCSVNKCSALITRVDLVEGLRVQTGSYELEYGGQRTASKQSAHLRVFIQSGQHQGTELHLQTQQLHTGNKY